MRVLGREVDVAASASIDASAGLAGDGGTIVVKADVAARVSGTLAARGTGARGQGGFIETSGAKLDVAGARVSAGASGGPPGQWLLDPTDVDIDTGQAATIGAALATTNVTVETAAGGSDPGDLTVSAGIMRSAGSAPTTLALRAHRNLEFIDGVEIVSTAGPLSVDLIARKDAVSGADTGHVLLREGSAIRTNGGNVLVSGGAAPRDAANGYAIGGASANGVDLLYATIDARAPGAAAPGSVEIRGRGGVSTFVFGPGTTSVGHTGVALSNTAIDGGVVSLTGVGATPATVSAAFGGIGVLVDASTVRGSESVSIVGTGGNASSSEALSAAGGTGVLIVNSAPAEAVSGARVELSGTGGSVLSASGFGAAGVRIDTETLGGGDMSIVGTGGHGGTAAGDSGIGGAGIEMSDARLEASGALGLRGVGGHGWRASALSYGGSGGRGVELSHARVRANGAVTIDGIAGASADAVAIDGSSSGPTLVESRAGGGVVIVGVGPSSGSSGGDRGVAIGTDSSAAEARVRASDAELRISGYGGNGVGVHLGETARVEASGAGGHVELRGAAIVAPGVMLEQGARVGSASSLGNIVIAADALDASDAIDLAAAGGGAVRTTGAIVLRPGSLDASGERVELPDQAIRLGGVPASATPFNLSSGDLATLAPGARGIVIGGSTHDGAISVEDALAFASNLTLEQSRSPGAQGISILQPLSAPGRTIGIVTGGGAAQSAPVVAGALMLRTGPSVAFANPGNLVGALSMSSAEGGAAFVNSGALTLRSVSATSSSGDSGGGIATVVQADSSAADDFLARTLSGDLSLNQDLSSASGQIALASAGIFLNSGGMLSAPSGRWTVWADTWAGENRGALTPSAPLPNVYGCSFGASACASGAVVPAEGNHFVYVARPTLSFTAGASREYGLPNPPLAISAVAGLRSELGDTLPDAISGSYSSTATQASPVGVYPLTASFSSPAGYILDARDGALTITPAMLLYHATPVSREYGVPNPALSGTVSGLRNGDTLAGATTGVLVFTTAATQSSNAGSYPIDGSGLVANSGNYTLAQAPGNATALTITAAQLSYLANAVSREFGLPNPALTGTVTGFRNGDTPGSATVGVLVFKTPATVLSGAGSYPILGSGLSASSGNYTFVQAPGNATALTITGATLTYVADPVSRDFGAPNPPLGGTVTGFRNADTQASATTGVLVFATPATQASDAGSYPIEGSGLVARNGNYRFVQAGANATALTIVPVTLSYLATPESREYGLPNPALTGTVTGLRNGQSLESATSGVAVFATPATQASDAGSYPIEGSGLVVTNGNYTLVQAPGNATALSIVPATLVYQATPVSREYGNPNPPLGGVVTGFRNADTLANATSGTLLFTTVATAASNVGAYPVDGAGLVAASGNYRFAQAESNAGALTVEPATLLYVATPAVRLLGQPNPALTGTVTGLRNADTLASATTGTASFATDATQFSPPGFYAINGSGLAARNYLLRQAESNAQAFAIRPPDAGAIGQIPGISRDASMQETYLYDRNLASPAMCVAAAPLTTPYGTSPATELLEIEWTRVRARPNLTNCVNLGERDYCKDF
ncbi:MAG: hypothetical protein KJZ83_15915 [Burkholderiaceae bacterium]|nr:hypothetical protein [Burkholderiaceae bacterium]